MGVGECVDRRPKGSLGSSHPEACLLQKHEAMAWLGVEGPDGVVLPRGKDTQDLDLGLGTIIQRK